MRIIVEEIRPWYDLAVRHWIETGEPGREIEFAGMSVGFEAVGRDVFFWKSFRITAREWELFMEHKIDHENTVIVSGEGDRNAFLRDTVYLKLSLE